MSFFKGTQWYHSYTDPIWPEDTFKGNLMFVFCEKIIEEKKNKWSEKGRIYNFLFFNQTTLINALKYTAHIHYPWSRTNLEFCGGSEPMVELGLHDV